MTDRTAAAILAVATLPPQKSGGVAAALWFFLAGLGGPWWYLGRVGSALFAIVVYWLLLLSVAGWVMVPFIWVLDGLAVSSCLKQHNRRRAELLQAALGAGASPAAAPASRRAAPEGAGLAASAPAPGGVYEIR